MQFRINFYFLRSDPHEDDDTTNNCPGHTENDFVSGVYHAILCARWGTIFFVPNRYISKKDLR